MDEVEMPMIFWLLAEMEQIPPQDFMAAAQMNHAREKAERDKKAALSGFERTKGRVRRRNNGD